MRGKDDSGTADSINSNIQCEVAQKMSMPIKWHTRRKIRTEGKHFLCSIGKSDDLFRT